MIELWGAWLNSIFFLDSWVAEATNLMQKLSLESKKDGSSAAKKVALWAVLGGFCFVKIFLVEGGDSLIIILIRRNHAFLICTIVAFWVAIWICQLWRCTECCIASWQVDNSSIAGGCAACVRTSSAMATHMRCRSSTPQLNLSRRLATVIAQQLPSTNLHVIKYRAVLPLIHGQKAPWTDMSMKQRWGHHCHRFYSLPAIPVCHFSFFWSFCIFQCLILLICVPLFDSIFQAFSYDSNYC